MHVTKIRFSLGKYCNLAHVTIFLFSSMLEVCTYLFLFSILSSSFSKSECTRKQSTGSSHFILFARVLFAINFLKLISEIPFKVLCKSLNHLRFEKITIVFYYNLVTELFVPSFYSCQF